MNKKNIKNENEYPWFKYYKDMRSSIDYPDVSMYELVKKTALKYPNNMAYSYFGINVRYKDLLKKIDESFKSFCVMGIKSNDVVSIIMPNTPEAIISFYALNKLGAICNMIHPLSSEEELKNSINETKTSYIIISDIVYEKLQNIKDYIDIKKVIYIKVSQSMNTISKLGYIIKMFNKKVNINDDNVISYNKFLSYAKEYKNVNISNVSSSNVAAILHSGATTGKAKGVVLTNMNFNSLILSELEINKSLKLGKSILAIMPIFHGFGLGCTFHACFTSGAKAIIIPSVNPKKFDEVILKHRPNVVACVPSILEGLTNSKKLKDEDLSFLECVICGGDTLSSKLNKKLDDFLYKHGCNIKVRTAYGLTECTAGVTMMPMETYKEESIGIPCPDFFIKICDTTTNEECKYNEVGEICINGPSVMKEYLNDEEETKKVLKKHKDGKIYLHSGDIGYMDEDGFVYFKSRLKRMIVSSGYNIYPLQIENIILSHPFVKHCCAIGVPHPYKKEVIKVYIVLKDGLVLNSEIKKSIKEHCKKNISAYALPYSYGYRKELPKTKLGKISYNDLINSNDNDDE